MATFNALRKTYGFLTPDLWPATTASKELTDEHSEFLANYKKAVNH
jgi:small subunit ribosomal protein S2e